MIKKILLFLFIMSMAFTVNAQTLRPSGLPTTNSPSRYDVTGYQRDSAFLYVLRDSFPAKYPSVIYHPNGNLYKTEGGTGAFWSLITDTTWLSNRIDLKLNIADTAAALSNYLRKTDTANLVAPYMKYSDTSNMLTPYHQSFYTATFDTATRILTMYPITGTVPTILTIPRGGTISGITTLTPYRVPGSDVQYLVADNGDAPGFTLKTADSATIMHFSDTVTMLAPYAHSQAVVKYYDTSAMLSKYVRYTDTANIVANRLKISDTATMLSNRLKISDTANMLAGYKTYYPRTAISGGSGITYDPVTGIISNGSPSSGGTVTSVSAGVGMNFTTITTTGIVNADTLVLSTRLHVDSIAMRKLNLTDTAAMLSNRLKISDTATMLRNHATYAETLTGKNISGSVNNLSNIANSSLVNSTISGIPLGSNLAALTNGFGITSLSYNGSTAKAVTVDTSSGGVATWALLKKKIDSASAAGGGSVSSVGLVLPTDVFTVTGSPVTTSGNLTGTFKTQTANKVFASDISGGPAQPTFRALVAADLPDSYLPISDTAAMLLPYHDKQNQFIFNTKDYGAYGDNVHDDQPAIQAAIDAAVPYSGIVIIQGSAGLLFKLNDSLTIQNGVRLVGLGSQTTVLMPNHNRAYSISVINSGSQLENFFLDCNGSYSGHGGSSGGILIRSSLSSNTSFQRLQNVNVSSRAESFTIDGTLNQISTVWVLNCDFFKDSVSSVGVSIRNIRHLFFNGCNFFGIADHTNIYTDSLSSNIHFNHGILTGYLEARSPRTYLTGMYVNILYSYSPSLTVDGGEIQTVELESTSADNRINTLVSASYTDLGTNNYRLNTQSNGTAGQIPLFGADPLKLTNLTIGSGLSLSGGILSNTSPSSGGTVTNVSGNGALSFTNTTTTPLGTIDTSWSGGLTTRLRTRQMVDSLQNNINQKLNISDTSSMLSNRLKNSDTSLMLSNYRRKTTLITNSDLTNSSVTINGNSVSLGSSATITANTTNALTFNDGGGGAASETTFDGSTAKTISYNTLGASPLAGSSSLVNTGTLTSGSIGSGFGNINIGSNTITAGAISGTTGTFSASIITDTEASYTNDYSMRRNSNALVFIGGPSGYYFNSSSNSSTFLSMNGSGAVFSLPVTASSIAKSGGTSSQALIADGSVLTLTNGTYTPTISNTSNVASSSVSDFQYMRVGNTVTVSGSITATATNGSLTIALEITLPVASTFTQNYQCAGTGSGASGLSAANTLMVVNADTSTHLAYCQVFPGGTASTQYWVHFTYQVL